MQIRLQSQPLWLFFSMEICEIKWRGEITCIYIYLRDCMVMIIFTVKVPLIYELSLNSTAMVHSFSLLDLRGQWLWASGGLVGDGCGHVRDDVWTSALLQPWPRGAIWADSHWKHQIPFAALQYSQSPAERPLRKEPQEEVSTAGKSPSWQNDFIMWTD